MADGATISVSAEVWGKKLALYMLLLKKNLGQALSEEWPLLMRKIIDFTPPFKTKGQPGASDLSVGRKAVAFDIYKVMRPFNPKAIRSEGLLRAVQRKDFVAYAAIASHSKDPRMATSRPVHFEPAFHLMNRNPRGRVVGRDRNQVVLGSDAGDLKRYVSAVQQRVGYAKSGWAKAYNLVNDPEGRSLPAYVQRQGTRGGEVVDDRANETNPSITAINGTPWAIRKDEGERIKADAYFSRGKAIQSKIVTFLRLSRTQAGLQGSEATT